MSDVPADVSVSERFAPRCASVDFEVEVKDRRIRCLAALRSENDEASVFESSNLAAAL